MREDAARLHGRLGRSDQQKLDGYLDSVRALEMQIEASQELPIPVEPPGDSSTYETLELKQQAMQELIVNAFITDRTEDARLVARPVFRDELVAVVPPSHPFARRPYIEPTDLSGAHLLLYNHDPKSSDIFRYVLGPAGVEPGRISRVPLTEAILELIRAGQGLGVMARWAIEPAIQSGVVKAVRIGRKGVFRNWRAATLRSRPEPKWQKDFVALMAAKALPAKATSARG